MRTAPDNNIWSNSSLPLMHVPVDCTFLQSDVSDTCAPPVAVTSDVALQAFNARPVAARTRLKHDSQDHCIVPPFFFAPTWSMSIPAEIIRQREIVETIVLKTEALRQHKFKVDLSYKATFPMNVPDTIETNRHITEEIYHSAWSDIIDAECKKFPMECLMNDLARMKNFEVDRKRHLKFVENEVWELYKLTMDLHPDTQVLIGSCLDTETLQRALMNPVLKNTQKGKALSSKGPLVKPKILTTQPVRDRITFHTS